jgi:hypothetical protein
VQLLKVEPSLAEFSTKSRLYYCCHRCDRTADDVFADLHDKPGTYYCVDCAEELKQQLEQC